MASVQGSCTPSQIAMKISKSKHTVTAKEMQKEENSQASGASHAPQKCGQGEIQLWSHHEKNQGRPRKVGCD